MALSFDTRARRYGVPPSYWLDLDAEPYARYIVDWLCQSAGQDLEEFVDDLLRSPGAQKMKPRQIQALVRRYVKKRSGQK